jgi:hypothetical protein
MLFSVAKFLLTNLAIDLTGFSAAGPHTPWAFYAVLALGFVAAVSIGSIAWYNSQRPPGWEDKERPDIVPKVDEK